MRVTSRRALCAFAIGIILSAGIVNAQRAETRLSSRGRELLAAARNQGQATVTLLVATNTGSASAVASALQGLGATIRYQEDQLGYVRVVIPTAQVEAAAAVVGVVAVDVDELIPVDNPRPQAEDVVQVDPPGPLTPGLNAYMPTRDIGAPQFVEANPTYDGRGVKIGIVDLGVDVLTPELQSAKLITGAAAPKIIDWVTFTDPVTDNDPTWIDMAQQVSGAVFTAGGTVYTAPAKGLYRFGVFNERDPRLGGELGNDVNRDGNPAGSSGLFAVLWNTSTNTVWVDTNQNRTFADDLPMTDFKINRDIGRFGTDKPATAVRESIPFTVQTNGKLKFVNIGIVSGAHGTHVAGIAAGKNFFGGEFDGVAPEAQIVSVRACLFVAGCTSHALLEGMIYVAKQANVDVINMSIGGLPALNDGNNARAILYDRLIDQSKVQMFLSAGNSGPGLNTVGDPGVVTKVMGVGAYVHKDTWLANYGSLAVKNDGVFVFSSRGPGEHGGFKPNIIAPGAAVSTAPAWQPGQPVAGTYALPPGYAMMNGTSMAAPEGTGAAALLISAAKQTGAQYKPEQLRQAIISTARFIPGFAAHEQGNGLVQVGAAWDRLRLNLNTAEIVSQADVNTIISDLLATPNKGPGIYQREGWTAGQSRQMMITFLRTKGGTNGSFGIGLVGDDDGTFTLGTNVVSLPLNTPVQVPITVAPRTAGVHSAILNLYDTATHTVAYQAMNTVVAAEQLVAANNFSVTRAGSADRPDKATFFFNVAPESGAFTVDVTGINGRVRMLRFHPYGLPFDDTNITPYQTAGTITRTTVAPTPGVWEVTVDTSRSSPTDVATFDVRGSVLGAVVSPNPDQIATASLGVPVSRSYTITNTAASFTGRATGTPLGSARLGPFSIANGANQDYPVVVTGGTTSLRATIGRASDPAADLDLFVYNCTSGTCVLAGQSADGDSEESVTIANPALGNWLVRVAGFAVPAGTTTYDYIDVFSNPAFGSVSITDADALRPAGASWTVPGSVTANAAPATGRLLFGNVRVRTATAVIGSGDIIVQSIQN
jgi:subtilisin family serine protease